ncbi:MAG: hypothetical protein JZU55_06650 [Afipia sp.]|nr:hypothetical protein [Afipia sp.]
MAPVMAIMAMTVASAIVDAEHAIDAANDTADACTHRTTDSTAHRPCRAIALANAFVCAAFHASDDALRMGRDRHCEDCQRRCCEREAPAGRREYEQGFRLHLENLQTGCNLRLPYNAPDVGWLRQVWRKHATKTGRSRNRLSFFINLKTKTLLKKPFSVLYCR